MSNQDRKALFKKQLKRAKEYRKLLKVKLPDRTKDVKEVVDDLWYIIWERNLLKPKIFKYSFVSDIFALSFAEKHLKGRPHYIIQGKDVKSFGLLKTQIALRYTGTKTIGTLPHKYDFPEGLPLQRKKTLRTMYRRNLRRSLQKLLKKKNKKMSEQFVLDKINEKPGAFFKKLKKQWFYELTFSVTFKKWLLEEEGWRIDEVMQAAKHFPKPATEIANIVTVLIEHYSDEDFDYKNETYTSAGIKLWNLYRERIWKYLIKKNAVPKLALCNRQEAYLELVARGFLPPALLEVPFDPKKDTYITSNYPLIPELHYPKKVKAHSQEVEKLIGQVGVTGYTSIHYFKHE